MTLSVGDLLKTPGLMLKQVAGSKGNRNPMRWVHVSELEDPTPWLKGGELLLTTGMGVGKTQVRQRSYVERLVEAGLAGLGFGIGFSYQRVPKAMVDAAERAAFPVFEVPYVIPFIAITEAVFTRLVAEQYDMLQRSLEAEHSMTRAVLDAKGVDGVVRALARSTGGWSVLFDLRGGVIAVEPASSRSHAKRLWSEIQASRPEGSRFGLSLVDRGQNVAVQPVSTRGRVEAYLAVGKKEPLAQFDRIVSSHAQSLLAIELTSARAVAEAERRMRGDVLEQILAGTMGQAEAARTLQRLGFELSRPVAVVALSAEVPPDRLGELCEDVLTRHFEAFLALARQDHVLVVVQPDAPGFLASLRAAVAARGAGSVMAGAGSLVSHDHLPQGVREARYALQVCQTESRPQAEFADLGTYQLLLSLQEPEALRTFASSVLGALDAYDEGHGGHLVPSLRAFLERNARWEAAAADLYVHRHTLRYRMRKVEELTGRELSSARDRMELFLALRARDLLSSSDRSDRVATPALAPAYKRRSGARPSAHPRSARKA